MTQISSDKILHHPDSTKDYYADFTDELEVSGTTLSGTPTITDATSDLTLTNKAVGSTALTLNDGNSIAANKYVKFTAAGGTTGTTYTVKISVSTSNSETLVRNVLLQCSST